MLGRGETGTTRLEEAVAAFRLALAEYPRGQYPLDWANAENNLGNVLVELGQRETGTARLEEAVAAYRAALQEQTRERVPLDWAMDFGNAGTALMLIADRTKDADLADGAVRQIEAALETLRSGGEKRLSAFFEGELTKARTIRDRLMGR
jgi:tetratricopeptide (TPR) repeat protein